MTFKPNKRGMDGLARQVSANLQRAGVRVDDDVIETIATHVANGRRVDTNGPTL
jgi:hypothetical protein